MSSYTPTQIDHIQRINRVLNYIQEHRDNQLSLDKLAAIACFSPYHFHRIFTAYMGETLNEYVTRVRLEYSTHQLCYTRNSITEIALATGYETPSAYSRAFKKNFGESPSSFRKRKAAAVIRKTTVIIHEKGVHEPMNPQIVKRDEISVMYVRRTGAYAKSAEQAWSVLGAYAVPKNLFGPDSECIGISYDDPKVTEAEKLRYDACITAPPEFKGEGEIAHQTIAGGKYAVFLHEGPYEKLEDVYARIYREWLPESGYQPGQCICFEKYLNSPESVDSPEELKTEIFISLES